MQKTMTNPSVQMTQTWLKALVLLGLGVYFAYNIVTGNLANYINERFVWLSFVAVVIFLLLGAAVAARVVRGQVVGAEGFEYDHIRITWPMLAVTAIPLILGTMVPSQPLGADAVSGGVGTRAVGVASEASYFIAPENRNVLDWLRAFNGATDMEAFNGERANVIGFVYREPDFAENEFMVARFTVSCCVADASALGLPVSWDSTGELGEGAWVRVQGPMQVGEFGEDVIPIVQATSIEAVEQPEHPYLYP